MKIEVNKNELERALIALGKLISRMSPIPKHKSLSNARMAKSVSAPVPHLNR